MNYNEAYNKIIDAYFKDEIQPMWPSFCFCGTLSNQESWCGCCADYEKLPYAAKEYYLMEKAMLDELIPFGAVRSDKHSTQPGKWVGLVDADKIGYEDALFKGMCAALEVLKQIHLDRGEVIDENIGFKKRELSQT